MEEEKPPSTSTSTVEPGLLALSALLLLLRLWRSKENVFCDSVVVLGVLVGIAGVGEVDTGVLAVLVGEAARP